MKERCRMTDYSRFATLFACQKLGNMKVFKMHEDIEK